MHRNPYQPCRVSAAVLCGPLFADCLWRRLVTLPGWLGRDMKQRQGAAGHIALTLGLMAVLQVRQRGKAAGIAGPTAAGCPTLDGSALGTGKPIWLVIFERYFRSLTQVQDTAFLGHIGLARLAHEKNSPDEALRAARQALSLRPKSAMAATQVLHLEAGKVAIGQLLHLP